ncbi:hypothetical protein PYW07_013658 [Mythimna separata]|uniref:Uncharacterized protein n=1 Tax=Mythimna separata TaxID=271217 RepID=A0AAD7YF59_MYTSE|nr:hypothetical protein PYW07_013658 [Mythimna separata]
METRNMQVKVMWKYSVIHSPKTWKTTLMFTSLSTLLIKTNAREMKVQAATAVHPTQTTVVPPMNMMQSTLMALHELEEADEDMAHAEIRNTFQMMGFCVHPEKLPKGELIYRKRPARLRPPKFRKNFSSKTYFDDDGNPYTLGQSKDSQDEREMQTDDDGTEVKSDTERAEYVPSGTLRTHPLASQDTSLDDDSIRLAEAAADSNDEEHREGKAEDGESTGTRITIPNEQ